jgi:predicted metal-dependent hydrolase
MHTIAINNHTVHWSLRLSARRRRTFQIRLLGVDQLEVTAPVGASTAKIEEVLQTKSGWILRQIRRLELNAENSTNASLTHGATLLFQGEPHSLLLLADGGKKPHVSYAPCTITLHLNELVGEEGNPLVFQSLKKWYLAQAQEVLFQRVKQWAEQIGVSPQRLSLRDQKTRWGSCSSRGAISLNWRLIMAPPAVIDYLVIHELCHLRHHNHSPAYWQEVARWNPDYRVHRRWLRLNGSLLGKLMPR